jgi:hypothetical protein
LRSAERSPSAVFDSTGKNATIAAQTRSAAVTSSTQIRMSGAIATTGVTCSTTAQGNKARSSARDWAKSTASSPPEPTATSRASNAMRSVARVEGQSSGQSSRSAAAIASGPGST